MSLPRPLLMAALLLAARFAWRLKVPRTTAAEQREADARARMAGRRATEAPGGHAEGFRDTFKMLYDRVSALAAPPEPPPEVPPDDVSA